MLSIFKKNYFAYSTRGAFYCFLLAISQQTLSIQEHKKGRACMAASIPKSGTGLLRKLLTHLSYTVPTPSANRDGSLPAVSAGEFIIAHFHGSDSMFNVAQARGTKVILIIRDPRDVAVSMYYYFGKGYAQELGIPFEERDTILSNIIQYWYRAGKPAPKQPSMQNTYESFLRWQQYPDAYITSFEKLIGPRGGGSEQLQKEEILRIAHFLEIPLTDADVKKVVENLFGGTSTFREGKIGAWKDHFTQTHVAQFKEASGNLLIRLGYETDNSWDIPQKKD